MAHKIKFELNYEGVGELLKSAEMQKTLRGFAEQVRNNCTQGTTPASEYGVGVRVAGDRAKAKVYAATPKAVRSNNKHNTLVKAVGGGG